MNAEALVNSPKRPKVFRPPVAAIVARENQSHRYWLAGSVLGFLAISLLPLLFMPIQRPAESASGAISGRAAASGEQTILLTDKDGTIVGQMAKIPDQDEKMSEIKTVSDVDKKGRRELLSIINKH